jgi:hypothetical protein
MVSRDECGAVEAPDAERQRKRSAETMTTEGKNRIMIYGPKDDGTYVAAYGVNRPALARRWAFYVDKILKAQYRLTFPSSCRPRSSW